MYLVLAVFLVELWDTKAFSVLSVQNQMHSANMSTCVYTTGCIFSLACLYLFKNECVSGSVNHKMFIFTPCCGEHFCEEFCLKKVED